MTGISGIEQDITIVAWIRLITPSALINSVTNVREKENIKNTYNYFLWPQKIFLNF